MPTGTEAYRAVLIGTAAHVGRRRGDWFAASRSDGPAGAAGADRGPADQFVPGLGDIPQVSNNLMDLTRVLLSPSGLFPPRSVARLEDPTTVQEVQQAIDDLPKACTLLCYYAGHGLPDEQGLCLALPGSVDEPAHRRATSLPLDVLLEQLTKRKQRRVVMILDCSYAGQAFRIPQASDVHLLAAVGKANKADYHGGRNTVFTAALLAALSEGVPNGSRYTELDALYRQVSLLIARTGRDDLAPQQRSVNGTGQIRIALNQAFEPVVSLPGLAARADYAMEVGLGGDPAEAARLFAKIERDSYRSRRVGPQELFGYRQSGASWTGQSGDPADAVQQLTAMLAGDLGQIPMQDRDLAEQSLKYWCSQL